MQPKTGTWEGVSPEERARIRSGIDKDQALRKAWPFMTEEERKKVPQISKRFQDRMDSQV